MNECKEESETASPARADTCILLGDWETERSSQLVSLFTKIALWNYPQLRPF